MSTESQDNHVADDQLIRWAYQESIPQPDLDHLGNCELCQQKLNQLKEVGQVLDGLSVAAPKFHAKSIVHLIQDHSAAIADAELVNAKNVNSFGTNQAGLVETGSDPSSKSSHPTSLTRGWVWATAMSLVLILFAVGFVSGGIYQAKLTRQMIRSELQQQSVSNNEVDSVGATRSVDTQKLDTHQVQEIERKLVSMLQRIQTENHQPTVQSLSVIQTEISKILAVQNRLRQDLQTMAITAENEINLTREDLRQLSEVVEFFLPVLH